MKEFKTFMHENNSKEEVNIKYGIIAIDENGEEVHFCAYENEPTEKDFDSLRHELNTDEEFGLVGQMENIKLIQASEDVLTSYREIYNEIKD